MFREIIDGGLEIGCERGQVHLNVRHYSAALRILLRIFRALADQPELRILQIDAAGELAGQEAVDPGLQALPGLVRPQDRFLLLPFDQ